MTQQIRDWLVQQFGDDALVGEIYARYRTDMSAGVAEARALAARDDADALRLKIHALKGMALVVGDQPAVERCRALERACRDGDAAARVAAQAALEEALAHLSDAANE